MSAALLFASTAAGMAAEPARTPVAVPSGAEVWLQEELSDRVPGMGLVQRYRFVMPTLAELVPPVEPGDFADELPPEMFDDAEGPGDGGHRRESPARAALALVIDRCHHTLRGPIDRLGHGHPLAVGQRAAGQRQQRGPHVEQLGGVALGDQPARLVLFDLVEVAVADELDELTTQKTQDLYWFGPPLWCNTLLQCGGGGLPLRLRTNITREEQPPEERCSCAR